MRKEPLRRLSLAVGATGMLGLALVAPALAGTNATAPGSSDGGSYADWVAAYPVAALMTEVESDEDELVSDHNDNDDEQANEDDQGEDQPGAVEDDSGDAAPEAKPAKHHKHHSNAQDENNDEQANDDDQGENEDQNEVEDDNDDDDSGDSNDSEDDGGSEIDEGATPAATTDRPADRASTGTARSLTGPFFVGSVDYAFDDERLGTLRPGRIRAAGRSRWSGLPASATGS